MGSLSRARLSFLFNPQVGPFRDLGEALIERYSGVPVVEADVLVSIGGDGSVLYALARAHNRTVYGIVPKESNSIAYTVNAYDPDEDLHECIEKAEKIKIHPLDVQVTYVDGKKESYDVYNSVNLVRDAGQAALFNLTATFNGVSQTIERAMGDGVAFSTPMGSTGLNYSLDGPILDYSLPAVIFTGMGIASPRGLKPIIGLKDEKFLFEAINTNGKRPLRLDIDGETFRPSPDNPIAAMEVSINRNVYSTLAVRKDAFHPFKRLNFD